MQHINISDYDMPTQSTRATRLWLLSSFINFAALMSVCAGAFLQGVALRDDGPTWPLHALSLMFIVIACLARALAGAVRQAEWEGQ